MGKTCTVPGCDRPFLAKGLCHAHYMRKQETGTVSADVPFKKRRAEHNGLRQNPLYDVWNDMIRRCTNPRRNSYENYGGRGITICERWMSLENFIADMSPRPDGYTLDRIDNDGNYEPSNCRWATPTQQGNNIRGNRRLTLGSETLTLTEWSKKIGIGIDTLKRRMDVYGWSVERTLTTPPRIMKNSRKNEIHIPPYNGEPSFPR
jgi:hypothetical protein